MDKKKKISFIIISCIIVFSIIIGIIVIINKNKQVPTAKEVFYNNVNSVVEIKAFSEDVGESYGTAVCVKSDGTFVTNAHVVTYTQVGIVSTFEEYSIRFAFEDEYRPIVLIKYDTQMDIAVLKIEDNSAPYKAIKINNKKNIDFGDKVYAIGNGSNYGLSITQGIVSMPEVNIEYENNIRNVIQCDLTISAGNSGGALLDKYGRLIGITTFRTKDNLGNVIYGIVYSVPIDKVLNYIKK